MTHRPGSQFESCPGATGEAGCTDFPDRAHRCKNARRHDGPHDCTCGQQWAHVAVPLVRFLPPRR